MRDWYKLYQKEKREMPLKIVAGRGAKFYLAFSSVSFFGGI
jgi:hypothetical protein